MSIKAIGYTRSSIENHETLAAQLMAINEYCAKREYNLVKNCLDTSDTHSDFTNLFADLSSSHFDVLVVTSLDRLTRERWMMEMLLGGLGAIGIRVETVESEDTF